MSSLRRPGWRDRRLSLSSFRCRTVRPGTGPVRCSRSPGGDQRATSVLAAPRHHQDRLAARVTAQEAGACQMGQVAAGVLHLLDQFDVVILDHRPIDLHHLCGVDGCDLAIGCSERRGWISCAWDRSRAWAERSGGLANRRPVRDRNECSDRLRRGSASRRSTHGPAWRRGTLRLPPASQAPVQ